MEKATPTEPLFRLRLVRGAHRLVPVAAGLVPPPGPPTAAGLIEVTVRGRTAAAPDSVGTGIVPTAVALLRTVFEDHHVDPEHGSCLFFNGNMIRTCQSDYDFSVTHRGDAVLLSEFTFGPLRDLPPVEVPLLSYTRQVVSLARRARAVPVPRVLSTWAQGQFVQQRQHLNTLLTLAERFLSGGARNLREFRKAYDEVHGYLRRPLELQVLRIETEGDPPPYPVGEDAILSAPGRAAGTDAIPGPVTIPWVVECRLSFGPIGSGNLLPVRVNGGDVAIARVLGFTPRGPRLALWGVSSGGLHPNDRLVGIQSFYP